MGRIRSFLCPTEMDRARLLEAGERVRSARTLCAAVLLVAMVLVAPWTGFVTFVVLIPVLAELALVEKRMARSAHPEIVVARATLMVLLFMAVGTALNGGLDSP